MYQMTQRIEIPITTLVDGTALLTVCPTTAFYTPTIVANSAYIPFASVALGSSTNPFVAIPTATFAPFFSQASSVITYAIDSVQIDFI